jgi:hypothetical protein
MANEFLRAINMFYTISGLPPPIGALVTPVPLLSFLL